MHMKTHAEDVDGDDDVYSTQHQCHMNVVMSAYYFAWANTPTPSISASGNLQNFETIASRESCRRGHNIRPNICVNSYNLSVFFFFFSASFSFSLFVGFVLNFSVFVLGPSFSVSHSRLADISSLIYICSLNVCFRAWF